MRYEKFKVQVESLFETLSDEETDFFIRLTYTIGNRPFRIQKKKELDEYLKRGKSPKKMFPPLLFADKTNRKIPKWVAQEQDRHPLRVKPQVGALPCFGAGTYETAYTHLSKLGRIEAIISVNGKKDTYIINHNLGILAQTMDEDPNMTMGFMEYMDWFLHHYSSGRITFLKNIDDVRRYMYVMEIIHANASRKSKEHEYLQIHAQRIDDNPHFPFADDGTKDLLAVPGEVPIHLGYESSTDKKHSASRNAYQFVMKCLHYGLCLRVPEEFRIREQSFCFPIPAPTEHELWQLFPEEYGDEPETKKQTRLALKSSNANTVAQIDEEDDTPQNSETFDWVDEDEIPENATELKALYDRIQEKLKKADQLRDEASAEDDELREGLNQWHEQNEEVLARFRGLDMQSLTNTFGKEIAKKILNKIK